MLEDRRGRAMAAAEIIAFALERNLPHIALGAAREAARSALLALAAGPRRLSGRDMEILREVAMAPPQHLAGRPAEREAVVRSMLAVMDRLFPPIPAMAADRDRPRDGGPERPSRRGPSRAGASTRTPPEARLGRAWKPHGSGRAPDDPAWAGRGDR